MIRQGQWDRGQITKAQTVAKPPDSINFGQACQYTSEAKSTFIPQHMHGRHTDEPKRLKDKFQRPNINLGVSSPNSNHMMTVAQATNDQVKS